MPRIGERTRHFTESVIRRMTRVANSVGAINLSQGFPDFDPPPELMRAGGRAGRRGPHQYAITWGAPAFREALARTQGRFMGIPDRPGPAHRGHLRRNRGHDGGHDDRLRPGRRGHHLLAVLRELRRGRDPHRARCRSTCRCGRRISPSTSRSCAGHSSGGRRRWCSATPPTRRARCSRASELEMIARPCGGVRQLRHHRRGLRAHRLRPPRAHLLRLAAGHVRADPFVQLAVQDLLHHRVAAGLRDRPARK